MFDGHVSRVLSQSGNIRRNFNIEHLTRVRFSTVGSLVHPATGGDKQHDASTRPPNDKLLTSDSNHPPRNQKVSESMSEQSKPTNKLDQVSRATEPAQASTWLIIVSLTIHLANTWCGTDNGKTEAFRVMDGATLEKCTSRNIF